MEGDLETAITPTPKEANLAETVLELTASPVCVAPEALVQAAQVLEETGLAEKRRELLTTDYETPQERTEAERSFRNEWNRAAGQVRRDSWPSPLGFAMEVRDLFPRVEFATQMPREADRPVLLILVEGQNDALKGAAGADLPSLPSVENELLARERYVVLSKEQGGRPLMVSYGATPWGALWGVQTLRQMVFDNQGRRYVRRGSVVDWPTMWFRGGKRCKDWWVRYKGNGRFESWPFEFGLSHVPRSHSWRPSGKAANVEQHKKALQRAVQDGAGFFLLDFNDGRFETSDSEEEPFPGDPARTVKYLFEELRKERKRLGSDIRLGYMPVAYTINRGADTEGAKLRAVNALEGVDFVMMNGLEVFTYWFPHDGAAAYRDVFGVECKLLMYDCQGCRRFLRTPDFRDAQVYKHLHGVSAQKSSPVFFIGLADYTWSPETYDPDRALKLAARELADRDPERYRLLLDYLTYYVENSYIAEAMPREQTLALYKEHTDGMLARLEKLKPLFERGTMARITALEGEITGPVRSRAAAWPMTREHGFKDYHVGRAGEITVDGRLDEAAWQHAPKMETFFPAPDIKGLDDKALPSDGRAIVARALYDDEALYVSYEVQGTQEEMMEYVRGAIAGELTEENPKKKPVFEMFIKPDLGKVLRWQFMHFVPEGHATFVKHYFDPEDPFAGNHMEHDPEIGCSVTGESSYTVEVRIPFWQGIDAPGPGDVWGVQLQLNRALAHRDTPYWLYHWTYSHDRNGLWAFEYAYGRWIFER